MTNWPWQHADNWRLKEEFCLFLSVMHIVQWICLSVTSCLVNSVPKSKLHEGRHRKRKSHFSPGVSGASGSQIMSITKTGKTAQLSSSSCACQLYFLFSHTQGEPCTLLTLLKTTHFIKIHEQECTNLKTSKAVKECVKTKDVDISLLTCGN